MRRHAALVLLFATACAGATVVAVPEPQGTPGQDPMRYAGFTATPIETLPDAYGGRDVDLRALPAYAALAGDALEAKDPDLDAGRFVDVLDEMLGRLATAPEMRTADGRRIVDALHERLAEVGGSLAEHRELGLGAAQQLPGVVNESWTEAHAQDVAAEGAPWDVAGRIQRGRAVAVPLYAQVEGPEGERTFVYVTPEQAIAVRTFCDVADRLRTAVRPVTAVAERLQANDEAWRNYLERGYPQFPWENLANDWLVSSAWNRPPARQFVLLHAEPGLVFDLDSKQTASVEPALLVHGVGHLWYFGDDRGWFAGASATAAVTSDDDQGLGYGITLHVGKTTPGTTLPHVNVGLLWHEGADGDDGLLVSFGIDLLRLLK